MLYIYILGNHMYLISIVPTFGQFPDTADQVSRNRNGWKYLGAAEALGEGWAF